MKAAALLLLALPVVLCMVASIAWDCLVASEAERAALAGDDDDGGVWPEFGGGVAPGDENNNGGRKV